MSKNRIWIRIAVLILLLSIWTIWSNTALELNTIVVAGENLPDAFSGYRIAHISDFHNTQNRTLNARLMQLLKEAEPDMIAITGDLIDSRPTNIEIALQFVEQAVKTAPCYYEEDYQILLSHRPELFKVYADAGLDLVLSGHAHGGQFRLPFIGGLIAPNQVFFPEYDVGIFTDAGTNMIVSRGIGSSIVSVRFNNRPEVVLVELRRGE